MGQCSFDYLRRGKPATRRKWTVMSRDKDVDPVGALRGMKGMRVASRSSASERGENDRHYPVQEETVAAFAQNGIEPAKVTRVANYRRRARSSK